MNAKNIEWKDIQHFHQQDCVEIHHFFSPKILKKGVIFTVWAPNAEQVCIIGDFTDWSEIPLNRHVDDPSIWQGLIDGATENQAYRFVIISNDQKKHYKIDPFGYYEDGSPNYNSVVYDLHSYQWHDEHWMKSRDCCENKPMNIYEVHLGSWKRDGIQYMNYKKLSDELIAYVEEMGYTHIELLPILAHPNYSSWGYQASNFFTQTCRYGEPKDLMLFVDSCHRRGIGVILDMVPYHFSNDKHGLRCFDGTPIFEKTGISEWGTCVFDYTKMEVRNYIFSAICFWLTLYHFDGIRYDAVNNMIFNYDILQDTTHVKIGENNENINFIKKLNASIHKKYPDVMLIAEYTDQFESIRNHRRLGFDYEWGMGWRQDTLWFIGDLEEARQKISYVNIPNITNYFYDNHFILSLSHDEVVHGKKSILDRCHGKYEEKFAQIKLLYLYQITHPGKKLNFMGNELGHFTEWNEDKELDWCLLDFKMHRKFKDYIQYLNHFYKNTKTFFEKEYDESRFGWIQNSDKENLIYAYHRSDSCGNLYIIILNFSGKYYPKYTILSPRKGAFNEIMQSDDLKYGGNSCHFQKIQTAEDRSLTFEVRPYMGLVFEYIKEDGFHER